MLVLVSISNIFIFAVLEVQHEKERHGRGMDQEERWNQFASTGKIMDYLEYRKAGETACSFSEKGSGEHERDSSTYRDDINSISHERIR